MKILLLNPPTRNIITTTQPAFIIKDRGLVPPLGLLYLATSVRARTAHEVRIVDCQIDQLKDDEIKREVIDYNPDIVGITMITFVLPDALNVANIVKGCEKALNKHIYTVAGGPHTCIFPEETAGLGPIDFVLAGEAEFTFPEFLENIEREETLSTIPGICYMREGRIIKGPPYVYITNLDSVPIPDRELIDYKRYSNILSHGLMTTMMTSRGCPYQCIFCERLGKRFRAASAGYVLKEIEGCLNLGIRDIFFHDDTFTILKDRIMDICELIKKRGLQFTFSIRSRVNTIDEEMIRALKGAGCRRISFGVESGVQRIIDRIKKGITLEQAENAIRLAKKYKILTLADFMIGHPDETIEDIRETLRFAKRLKPDYVQFSITTPYPGTELYREALDRGIITHDVWREFARRPTPEFIPPRWEEMISKEELYKLEHWCYSKFYLTPAYALRQLLKIRGMNEFKKRLLAGLRLFINQGMVKCGIKKDGFR